ncbi:SseB family protein [Actinomadura macra]|uniref:SseB family protein n=1 Tax=Actinomadura macra TaxID=46164 RepID=UPI00082E32CF|nr:SseB family protein [Actinomadura macra]
MDWNDFAQRLTLELSRLPVKSFLIVQRPSGLPYVQAMRSENALDAEAVGSAFLPRPLAPHQERRLKALGWEEPDEDQRWNWWQHFALRGRGAQAPAEHLEACALLAGLMVGACRDVYEVVSPIEMVYEASRSGPRGGPLALPGLGIALAIPEDESERAVPTDSAARPAGSTLEAALAEAREHGDQQAYLELLARAVLYLPASGEPSGTHQFATAQFGDGTFVLAFTSPEAMDRSLQGQAVHHRQASLPELSRHWPHPEWQLAVNPGLPSASYLDANALFDPVEDHSPAPPAPPGRPDVRVAAPSPAPRRAPPPPRSPRPSTRSTLPEQGGESSMPQPSEAVWTAGRGSSTRPQPPARAASTPQRPSDDLRAPRDAHGGEVAPRDVPAPPPPPERLTVESATEVVIMQKVVRPEHVQHYLEGGYDLVAGYVHRLPDVQGLDTPAAVIRGLGLVYEGSPFSLADERVFAVRWPAVKPPLFRRPFGGTDETSMGIVPGGWVIEKAPFPGAGDAPGEGPAVPEFKIESQRLPHGAELVRIDASGAATPVAGYDADLRRWLVRLPGGQG